MPELAIESGPRSNPPLRWLGAMFPALVVGGKHVAQAAPALLCSIPARFHLRRLLEPFLPRVVMLSPLEIPPMVPVQSSVEPGLKTALSKKEDLS